MLSNTINGCVRLRSFYAIAAVHSMSQFFWDIAPSAVDNILKQRDSPTFKGTSDAAPYPKQPNHRKDIKVYMRTAFNAMQEGPTASSVYFGFLQHFPKDNLM